MSFLMYLAVGVCAGLIVRIIAIDRFRFGIAMAEVFGVVGAFFGGAVGAFISRVSVTTIDARTSGGCVIGAFAVIALAAAFAHFRHELDVARKGHEGLGE